MVKVFSLACSGGLRTHTPCNRLYVRTSAGQASSGQAFHVILGVSEVHDEEAAKPPTRKCTS